MVRPTGQWARALLCLFFCLGACELAQGSPLNKPRKRLMAKRISNGQILIDGKLQETAWNAAPVGSDFDERVPNPGDRPPVKTRVRIVYDDAFLYVAVESEFESGDQPVIRELRRDSGRIWADDAITLKFDVAHDKRTSINLGVNFAGAQVDGIGLNNGRQFRREFDAVWDAQSAMDGSTWVVEYKIPYAALGLTASDSLDRILGFNVSRDHNARNATYDWTLIAPELGPSAASEYGALVGIQDVGLDGHPVRISPYLLTRRPGLDGWSGDAVDIRGGLDIRTRLHQDLWAEITTLTDFAEVDLDDPLINLSRFPLFLTEKRPFFLSGLNIFEFGQRGAAQPFFSRRIGLDSNADTVPIWLGTKLYGQVDRLGVGFLNVTTAKNAEQPMLNQTVGRLKYTAENGSNLGILVTSANGVDAPDEPHRHTIGGDATLSLMGNRLELSTFADLSLSSEDDVEPGSSGQLAIDYRGQVWQPGASVTRVDDNYDPALGFVRRRDVTTVDARSRWTIRSAKGPISETGITLENDYLLSSNFDDYLGRNTQLIGSLGFRSGWRITSAVSHAEDVVEETFTLPTDEEVAAGTYQGVSAVLQIGTPWRRNPAVSATYSWSDAFYGGTQHQLSLGSIVSLGAHFRWSTNLTGSRFRLPGYQTSQTLSLNSGITAAFTPTLFWENNIQGVSTTESGRILSRIRWRYLPGSDAFLVYQEDVEWSNSMASTDRRFVFKLNYWWDTTL
ncbi:MAG: DUF5916 domain-containing protein [Bradymonadia bacterium]